VPTTRGETHLAAALALGESLGVPVLVLHSPPGATQPFGPPGPTESTVVLTMAESRPALPDLETFRFFPNGSTSDLHQKRNVALAIAHVAGWRTLFFLDDDIDTPRPGDVMRAVASLDRYTAAGLPALRYPDNSIVCHANRLIGRKQDVFVGGAALAVNVDQADSFFPDLYNEDWLFLAPHLDKRRVARVGAVTQRAYAPFADPDRARLQEFGDLVGEACSATCTKPDSVHRHLSDTGERSWRRGRNSSLAFGPHASAWLPGMDEQLRHSSPSSALTRPEEPLRQTILCIT
jgi:hypothetical protein